MDTVARMAAAYICVALEQRYAPTRIMTTSNRPPGGFMSNYFLPRSSTRTRPANEDKTRASIRVLETIVGVQLEAASVQPEKLLLSPRISVTFLQIIFS